MKILIFSDCHLTTQFQEKKFRFLQKIISDADQVIINGDLWENDLVTFSQFASSQWKHLFPVLKTKKAIYIHGNHDLQKECNEKVNLFSDLQTTRYELKVTDKVAIIEHGHRLLPLQALRKIPRLRALAHFSNFMEYFMTRTVRLPFQTQLKKLNTTMKKKLKDELKQNEVYVCGHTHCAEIDLENSYYNSGFIRHGLGQYLTIEDMKITAHEEWYDN